MVKKLCSTDAIRGEFKYHNPFTFEPTHTLVVMTNHLPRIADDDHGIWRRVLPLPFAARIGEEQDVKAYDDCLAAQAGGAILKWLAQGASEVVASGGTIDMPAAVERSLHDYRAQNDWLSDFIDRCCGLGDGFRVGGAEIWEAYLRDSDDDSRVGKKELGIALSRRFKKKKRGQNGIHRSAAEKADGLTGRMGRGNLYICI